MVFVFAEFICSFYSVFFFLSGILEFLSRQTRNLRRGSLPCATKVQLFRESTQIKTQSVPNYFCPKPVKLDYTNSHHVLPHFPEKQTKNRNIPIEISQAKNK